MRRNGSVGRPKLVINLTQIDYLHSLAVYRDKDMPHVMFQELRYGGG